jgi:hypothetical protein
MEYFAASVLAVLILAAIVALNRGHQGRQIRPGKAALPLRDPPASGVGGKGWQDETGKYWIAESRVEAIEREWFPGLVRKGEGAPRYLDPKVRWENVKGKRVHVLQFEGYWTRVDMYIERLGTRGWRLLKEEVLEDRRSYRVPHTNALLKQAGQTEVRTVRHEKIRLTFFKPYDRTR